MRLPNINGGPQATDYGERHSRALHKVPLIRGAQTLGLQPRATKAGAWYERLKLPEIVRSIV